MNEDAKDKANSLSPEAKVEWETYKKNEMSMASTKLDASPTLNPTSSSQLKKKRAKPPTGQPSGHLPDKIPDDNSDDIPH